MIELISIGDQLTAGKYELHSRFARATNFRYGDTLAAVVDEDIGGGPLNIVVKRGNARLIRSLIIADSILYLNGNRFPSDAFPLFHSKIDLNKNIDYKRFFLNIEVFKKFLIENAPTKSLAFLPGSLTNMNCIPHKICRGTACRAPMEISPDRPTPRILSAAGRASSTNDVILKGNCASTFEKELSQRSRFAVLQLETGNILNGVRMLKGLGYGLTPAGDDFIAGMMCALRFAGLFLGLDYRELISRVYDAAVGGNFLSNAFLHCAKEGWLLSKQKILIEAILYGNESEVKTGAKELLTIGGTSGADWGTGFVLTLNRAREML